MVISLRKTFLLIILALALLASLIGWSMRAAAVPAPSHSHLTGFVCPPPPFLCE
ncbi:MAG TPA: hypothetical protein VJO32_02285 [Ktedonobacteraceae bacterium]|nr:hypothetical protein [Ktedonobacteraceae bacterium]